MSSAKATSDDAIETEEHYEFAAIENAGKVIVANHAHGSENVAAHTYTVTVEGGKAVHCTCPAHTYSAGSKHREAVENNPDVLASADPDPLAPIEREADCDCDHGVTEAGQPCFRCVVLGGVR